MNPYSYCTECTVHCKCILLLFTVYCYWVINQCQLLNEKQLYVCIIQEYRCHLDGRISILAAHSMEQSAICHEWHSISLKLTERIWAVAEILSFLSVIEHWALLWLMFWCYTHIIIVICLVVACRNRELWQQK